MAKVSLMPLVGKSTTFEVVLTTKSHNVLQNLISVHNVVNIGQKCLEIHNMNDINDQVSFQAIPITQAKPV